MEKYSQYRDKGSGIAPFFPILPTPAGVNLPLNILLFAIRVPVLIFASVSYFAFFCWLPIGSLGKKAALWVMLGVPGMWWVDLQIDGVKKGTLSSKNAHRFPQPGAIIVSSLTSPIDALYLAAIFDPIFTISYPNSRLIRPCTLLSAILHPLSAASLVLAPPSDQAKSKATTLADLQRAKPNRIIVVLSECTTSNGRGILPLSPSILSSPAKTRIFPVSLRYTPADITTPLPGPASAWNFLWNLCSKPTHTIRVRIAESVHNTAAAELDGAGAVAKARATSVPNSYNTNFLDTLDRGDTWGSKPSLSDSGNASTPPALTDEERNVLDKIAESLARLGRVKRVGLGVREKAEFVKAWTRRRR